ncbi:hypothetical protein EGN72_12865 [Pseudorhodobacter sp. E13]|uniref:DUF7282 domain-containing protein n=1 Tax=Pseudorhodobacter sp. E13 TaxID=2487931 RepID=UPI000F8E88A8|nr:hypothetical protein EGN72_12865 [Pseudorhodobacter sp. E13]
MKFVTFTTATLLSTTMAFAAGDMVQGVTAADQSVANGIVSAEKITAAQNGWLVVHRTDASMKPGPVVAYAPIREGETMDVAAILTEPVAPGDMLMLMVHGEDGGNIVGNFEYTLGAKEDGPVRIDGNLVMTVITVQ